MSYSYQKGFSWPFALFGLVVIVILGGVFTPFIFSRGRPHNRANAIYNAKVIAGGLSIFRSEYGSYPCDATRKILEERGADNLPHGTSANAYLAQLIVDFVDSEIYFYTPAVEGIRKGDDEMTPGRLLEKGENGFAYIMAEDGESLNFDRGDTPLVIAPIKRAGTHPVLDREAYDGKYVYGTAEGSARMGNIDDDGTALSEGRAHLFEGGRDSLFGNQTPVIKYPLGF